MQTKSEGNTTKTKHLFQDNNEFGKIKLLSTVGIVDTEGGTVQHPRKLKEFSQLITRRALCLA